VDVFRSSGSDVHAITGSTLGAGNPGGVRLRAIAIIIRPLP
jgi:hypothetical protein